MQPDPERLERIETYADAQIQRGHLPCVAWQIDWQGEVISRGERGFRNVAQESPLSDDTIYYIYSMTKPIISVLALMLIERGQLQLYHPLHAWVPSMARLTVSDSADQTEPQQRPITIEDLLTHRAGLSYDFLPECHVSARYREARLHADGTRTMEEFVNTLSEMPLAFQPGSAWRYSVATDVLAHVIERVCDAPIGEVLNAMLLKPLGMTDTAYAVAPSQQNRLATVYGDVSLSDAIPLAQLPAQLREAELGQSHPIEGGGGRGGHGLFSTVKDYRRFMQVLIDGRTPDGQVMLSAPMVDFMWRNRIDPNWSLQIAWTPFRGYGWNLFGRVLTEPHKAVALSMPGEGGWSGAASTSFWVDRARGFHGVVMSQYLNSAVPLGVELRSLAYAALVN